jgi:hypothetical protein
MHAAVAELGRAERALVLDGQRSHTRTRGWCQNGPDELRYLVDGRYVRPRCKRRDCPRCWALRSRELARCLVLDAREQTPALCLTLTTQTPWEELDPATYRRGSATLFQRLRRVHGKLEYFGAIEFTTGLARSSGGHRRLHGHYLLKTDAVDVLELEQVVRDTWERVTGAYIVEVAALVSPGAALGYLGLHHRKPSQAPPAAWRGMTERASLGYWHRPIAELRDLARAELRAEALAWRTGTSVELAALELAAAAPAKLRRVRSRPDRVLLDPQGAPTWAT